MTINFTITNTTSSEVVLSIDGTVISSQFVFANSQAEFSLEGSQIVNANRITIENSDIIYDITETCKKKVNEYVKPVYKVEPGSGVHVIEDDDEDNSSYYTGETNFFGSSNIISFGDSKDSFDSTREVDLPPEWLS